MHDITYTARPKILEILKKCNDETCVDIWKNGLSEVITPLDLLKYGSPVGLLPYIKYDIEPMCKNALTSNKDLYPFDISLWPIMANVVKEMCISSNGVVYCYFHSCVDMACELITHGLCKIIIINMYIIGNSASDLVTRKLSNAMTKTTNVYSVVFINDFAQHTISDMVYRNISTIVKNIPRDINLILPVENADIPFFMIHERLPFQTSIVPVILYKSTLLNICEKYMMINARELYNIAIVADKLASQELKDIIGVNGSKITDSFLSYVTTNISRAPAGTVERIMNNTNGVNSLLSSWKKFEHKKLRQKMSKKENLFGSDSE